MILHVSYVLMGWRHCLTYFLTFFIQVMYGGNYWIGKALIDSQRSGTVDDQMERRNSTNEVFKMTTICMCLPHLEGEEC